MSARPNENPYPSDEEFGGYYNIPDDQYTDVRIPVRRSVEVVPEFELSEMWDVYDAATKWFADASQRHPDEPVDPLVEPPFYVREGTDDRTQMVDADFDRVSVELLRRIQREFLARFPLWRVILAAEDSSTAIVIYPTLIRFGNHPADVDPDEALRELVPRAIALRENRLRPRRAEIAYLQRTLPDAMRAIDDRPYLILGVLDNYSGDYSRLTICVLVRGSDSHAIDVEAPAGTGKGLVWSTSSYGVNAEGAVISESDIPKTAPFCVARRLPPADYRGLLTIVERDSGKSHSYELKSENITRTVPQK